MPCCHRPHDFHGGPYANRRKTSRHTQLILNGRSCFRFHVGRLSRRSWIPGPCKGRRSLNSSRQMRRANCTRSPWVALLVVLVGNRWPWLSWLLHIDFYQSETYDPRRAGSWGSSSDVHLVAPQVFGLKSPCLGEVEGSMRHVCSKGFRSASAFKVMFHWPSWQAHW